MKLSTVAASTMSPLSVYSRGNHVFSVAPDTSQILATSGTAAAPAYSFAASTGTGISQSGGILGFASGGTNRVTISSSGLIVAFGGKVYYPDATAALPSVTSTNTGTDGLFFSSAVLGVAVSAIENSRFVAGGFQASKGTADAVSYTINARKARGTVASPTVITTGDDLLTIRGYGYVGSTNTYQEAASIVFDSTGTISDSTTGIGGILRFNAAKVGAEQAEIMRLTAGTTTGGGWMTLNEADANPGTGDLTDGDEVAIYVKGGNITFAQNVGGTINFLYTPIDGSTATWTANTTGP